MNTPTFAELGLDAHLLTALEGRGFTSPTAVQAATFAPGREGRDLLVQSRTGSGKTLAFGLPLLHRLEPGAHPQAIILAPTRELAQQVATELRSLQRVDMALLVGGLGYGPQLAALSRGAQIVVGTPGRVMDHLDRGSLDLSKVRMVVLDECDEMLNMGFLEDVETILAKVPKGPQTYLFSATLPGPIAKLAGRFLKDPVKISLSDAGEAAAHGDIAHTPVVVADHFHVKALVNLLLHDEPSAALIFTKTKAQTEEVAEELTASGLPAAFLHGDLAQATRARILEQFKKGRLRYMVATDVAARGIDVSGLPLVVNLGIPTQMESYIHRSGRTGRAGAKGTSLAIVNLKESRILSAWARRGGLELTWRTVPGPEELRAAKAEHLRERVAKAADDAHRKDAKRMLGQTDPVELVAGLLALLREDEPEGYEVPAVNASASRKPFTRDGAGPKRPYADREGEAKRPWVPKEEWEAQRAERAARPTNRPWVPKEEWEAQRGERGDRPQRPWVPDEEWRAKKAQERGFDRPYIPEDEWQARKAAGELPPRPAKPGFKPNPKGAARPAGKPFAPKKRDK
ncbi:MAG TPA: DEAD/DEAH box helicase [Holophagaceae bacterium]|nr:DEAD/DEAH box helicase [Holophagaceae bacterium]